MRNENAIAFLPQGFEEMPKIRITFSESGHMQAQGRTLTVEGLSPVFGSGPFKDEDGKPSRSAIAEVMAQYKENGKNARGRASKRKDGV